MQQNVMGQNAPAGGLTTIIEPLYRVKGWMKFAGIMTIIGGALEILTIWGIIIAWIPIWMGILLVSASNLLEQASTTKNGTLLRQSFEKLATYFKIMGILLIVSIILAILGIIAAITIPALIGLKRHAMGI